MDLFPPEGGPKPFIPRIDVSYVTSGLTDGYKLSWMRQIFISRFGGGEIEITPEPLEGTRFRLYARMRKGLINEDFPEVPELVLGRTRFLGRRELLPAAATFYLGTDKEPILVRSDISNLTMQSNNPDHRLVNFFGLVCPYDDAGSLALYKEYRKPVRRIIQLPQIAPEEFVGYLVARGFAPQGGESVPGYIAYAREFP